MSSVTALYAGSFDPFTIGHADIVERALKLFDRVIIGIGVSPDKTPTESAHGRADAIAALYAGNPGVEVKVYNTLTTDFAASMGATCLVRGVRDVADFEKEKNLADLNSRLTGIETMIFFSRPGLACVSSSAVRELKRFGADVSAFLPSSETINK